jgi:hypothetical protein
MDPGAKLQDPNRNKGGWRGATPYAVRYCGGSAWFAGGPTEEVVQARVAAPSEGGPVRAAGRASPGLAGRGHRHRGVPSPLKKHWMWSYTAFTTHYRGETPRRRGATRRTSSTAQPRQGRGLTATSVRTSALLSTAWAAQLIRAARAAPSGRGRGLCARPCCA